MSGYDEDGSSMDGVSGDQSGETPSIPVWLPYIYLMASGAVFVVFTVFIVTVLIVRYRKHRRAKLNILDNCDYENITDQAIIELFEVLDKRNNSTSIKSPTSLSDFQISPTEKSLSSAGFTFANAHELIVNSQLNSPTLPNESIDSKNHSINSPARVNVALLKPLSTKPTLSCESVYDELDSANSPQHNKDELSLENVYDDARTLSPKLSPQPIIEHVYDDTITSPPGTRNKSHSSSGTSSLNSATLRQHNEVLFRMEGDRQTKDRKDVISVSTEGYYVLPDNFPPPSSYSYTKTHHLVMSPTAKSSQSIGEVRVQNDHHQTPPTSSVYTNIDEVIIPQRRRDSAYMQIEDACVRGDGVRDCEPDYSNVYELDNDKYVYASEHMLVSPTRKDGTCGEVVTKPQEHQYDPIIIIRPKSNSLPGSAHSKGHTYVNLKSSKTVKVSTSKPLDPHKREDVKFHFGNETQNPMYSSTDELDIETVNPLYADSSRMRDEALMHQNDSKTHKVGRASSSRDLPTSDKDYFTSTREWLEPPKTTRMVINEEEGFLDHTYMGILVRERVDPDYSYPKPSAKTRQVTLSGNPKQERELRIKRTYSLDNAYPGYENRAMWLPEKEGGKPRVGSLSQENRSGYMGLYRTGYESAYNNTFSLSQV